MQDRRMLEALSEHFKHRSTCLFSPLPFNVMVWQTIIRFLPLVKMTEKLLTDYQYL